MKTDKNILIAFILNLGFSIFEIIGGLLTSSIAIISDAFHDFVDAFSIGLSYILERKSKKKPDYKYTYGYMRFSVLGAFLTTTFLAAGSIVVMISAINRLFNPVEVHYNGMIIISIIGIIVNFLAAYQTKDGDSLNQKSVNLHMLEDVLGWVVVFIGSILMKFTDISYIDSIMSIGIACYILIHALKNLKSVLDLFLVKTPANIDINHLKKELQEIKNVTDIHHIHVWSIDGINNYATLHAVSDAKDLTDVKKAIKECLKEHEIAHSTIELESSNEKCPEHDCVVKVPKSTHHHHH